jgi:hypothetical protein
MWNWRVKTIEPTIKIENNLKSLNQVEKNSSDYLNLKTIVIGWKSKPINYKE